MKKIRMLLPTGAVIGMLVVGTAFPAMAAADSDTAKFVRGTTILKYRTRTATWKS